MGLWKRLVPGFIRQPVRDLYVRIGHLEGAVESLDAVVDALILSPTYTPGDDVGFNGQMRRKEIFADITAAVPLDGIVETGTWLGNTTAYMAETSRLPVYSCDVNPRYNGIAKMRLANVDGVHLSLSDSREFLRELSSGPLAQQCVFFYLDAHWYEDVPLTEEFEWIAAHWDRCVVMVDDFSVPDDPGYEYDTYGRPLDLTLFEASIASHGLVAFSPAAPSSEETGRRRGCVVLSCQGELSERLAQLGSLRPHP